MKTLNLGFESLGESTRSSIVEKNIDQSLMFELIETSQLTHNALMQLDARIKEGDDILLAFENLTTINTAISKYGITPSIEALLGVGFSTEGLVEKTITRFIEWLKAAWVSFTVYFDKLFDQTKKWNKIIDNTLEGIEDIDFTGRMYNLIVDSDLSDYLWPKGEAGEMEFIDVERREVELTLDRVGGGLQKIQKTMIKVQELKAKHHAWYRELIAEVSELYQTGDVDKEAFKQDSLRWRTHITNGKNDLKKVVGRCIEQARIFCSLVNSLKQSSNKTEDK